MNKYRIQRLVTLSELEKHGIKGKTGFYAPVPFASDHTTMVIHRPMEGDSEGYMVIKRGTKPVGVRTFDDKFGRDKKYRLYYYPWSPFVRKAEPEKIDVVMGMREMPQQYRDQIRSKLGLR